MQKSWLTYDNVLPDSQGKSLAKKRSAEDFFGPKKASS